MCPSSSGVLEELVGNFLGDSIYSKSLSLSTELAAEMTSLSGLVGSLAVEFGPSVGCAQFDCSQYSMVCRCQGQQSW